MCYTSEKFSDRNTPHSRFAIITTFAFVAQVKPTGYPGNKASYGSFQKIINHFPPHNSFYSLCGGSGAVEFKKKLAPGMNVVFEISPAVVEKYWQWKHGYKVLNEDFFPHLQKLIKRLAPDNLIYGDVPYPFDTRRSDKILYGVFDWTDQQHEKFLKLAKLAPCFMAISSYKNDMYDEALKGWNVIEWDVMTHGGPAKEALYMNYEPPKELHQYDFLGEDFIERNIIKRTKKSFARKFAGYSETKRYAIMDVIQQYLK